MEFSNNLSNLTTALAKVQAEIKNPIKNQENKGVQGTPKYANLEDTLQEYVRPVLARNGMSFVQSITNDENGRVGVCTALFHESGEYIKGDYVYCEVKIPTRERDGKEILTQGQATGVVITYLRRYSLNAMIGINGDKDTDGSYGAEETNEPLTYEQALDYELTFGKHSGKTLKQIYKEDIQYIEWLYKGDNTDKRIKEAIDIINDNIAKLKAAKKGASNE